MSGANIIGAGQKRPNGCSLPALTRLKVICAEMLRLWFPFSETNVIIKPIKSIPSFYIFRWYNILLQLLDYCQKTKAGDVMPKRNTELAI